MISRSLVSAAFAAVFLGGLSMSAASAMPLGGFANTVDALPTHTENVRWVCGPYRCVWRPGRYWARPHYGFYGPRPWRPYRYGFYGPRRYWR